MEIWLWIIGVVAVIILAVVWVDRRRGSTGASKSDDIAGSAPRPPITFRGTKGE